MKKTKYQIIADELRSAILAGKLQVDQVISSELQLQKDYGVSRHTVREAIAQLVNEGYLRKEKGSGTYVSDHYLTINVKQSRKKTIGVITTYLSDYIFPSIIRGIEKELSLQGYSLLLSSTNNDVEQEKKSLEMMLSYGVDGLIVEPTKSNQYNPNLAYYLAFKEQGIPFVMINACYEELAAPSIQLDDVQSGYLATKELLAKGHRHLVLITKMDDLQGKNRMKGFIKAFEEQSLVFSPEHILTYTTESKQTLPEQIRHVLTSHGSKVTGFVCYNDEIALEVIRTAENLNLIVPADLSVIGQDDSFMSHGTGIQLTTLTHPKEKMGYDAAQWIIGAVEGKKALVNHLSYQPELIPRASISTPNK